MVYIEDKKINPSKKIIDDILLQIIYMPLESKLGYVYKPTVKVGDYVCIGDVLGENDVTDFPLKSSVSGTVVGMEKKYISNGKMVPCLVIENDFKEKYKDKPGKKGNITKYSKKVFLYMLKKNGITGLAGSDFPTYIKYDSQNNLKYLIINGTECEIFSSADNCLMYNYPEEILEGIDAIMEIMHIDKAYIAIKENNSKIIKRFLRYINTYSNIKLYGVMDAYPVGYERNLVSEILGLSYDKYPTEVGTIVDNVSTIYAIYEMLKYNHPLTDRIVTIAGEGVKKPGNYKVKIGTNFSEIMMKTDGYSHIKDAVLVAGGAMMGKSIPSDELIVTKDLTTILVLKENSDKESPCIKCGKCSEVCPVDIMPVMILDNQEQAEKLKIDKCINCGLCSYVCPSKIEVLEKIKEIRENIS